MPKKQTSSSLTDTNSNSGSAIPKAKAIATVHAIKHSILT
jgi:hypothetical protein